MIDLTNKNVDEINALISKYAQALEFIHPREQAQFAVLIQIAYEYIELKYMDLNADWKAWCFVVLKKMHQLIHTEAEAHKIINEFIEYYHNEYQSYIDDLGISASEYDRDVAFVYSFTPKK